MHAAGNGFDQFRACIRYLPFACLQHLVHPLPSPNSVVRSGKDSQIVGFQHLVDLVGDGVSVSDVLEICRVKVHGENFSALSLGGRRYKSPDYFCGKLVSWQMSGDKFPDGFDSSILGADVKMSRGTRFSKAIVQTEKMCVPPLGAD